MKPPYELTSSIIKRISKVSELIGKVKAFHMDNPSPKLRKKNRIKTIHSSLSIEGNTLTQDQITALLEKKIVVGSKKEILEVQNAIKVYQSITDFKSSSSKSFLLAHGEMMKGLIDASGTYRSGGVGIMKGSKVEHMAPPASRVPGLMNDLFKYLESDEIALIKSCVFHYEMEFIHPFEDGNGRMGRLWQTIILMDEYPVFQFIPFETFVGETQSLYYTALRQSDKSGSSTPFIEYMMAVIEKSLNEILDNSHSLLSDSERLKYFIEMGISPFVRKDYLNMFKHISTATATRDLKKGLQSGLFKKTGEGNQRRYTIK